MTLHHFTACWSTDDGQAHTCQVIAAHAFDVVEHLQRLLGTALRRVSVRVTP